MLSVRYGESCESHQYLLSSFTEKDPTDGLSNATHQVEQKVRQEGVRTWNMDEVKLISLMRTTSLMVA